MRGQGDKGDKPSEPAAPMPPVAVGKLAVDGVLWVEYHDAANGYNYWCVLFGGRPFVREGWGYERLVEDRKSQMKGSRSVVVLPQRPRVLPCAAPCHSLARTGTTV